MKYIIGCIFISFFLNVSATAQAIKCNGCCGDYEFELKDGSNDEIDLVMPLRVINQGAKVYSNPEGGKFKDTMNFGVTLEAMKISNSLSKGRVLVKLPGEEIKTLGWMDRTDLLCRDLPLKDGNLERKMFIKTRATDSIKGSEVPAFDSSSGNGIKAFLSRFELYFIIAEDLISKRYLLTPDYSLKPEGPLTGWVDKENGIPWNSTLALRPSDDTKQTWIYKTKDAALSDNGKKGADAWPTVGNIDSRWYTFKHHIPILKKEKYNGLDYYFIAAPTVAVEAKRSYGIASSFGVGTNPFKKMPVIGKLQNFKNVDIFFLVDGTKSMLPNIKKVRAVVENIRNQLIKQQGWGQTKFRWGFRVFRDSYVYDECESNKSSNCPCTEAGVCEGIPFTIKNCGTKKSGRNEWENFRNEFWKISMTDKLYGDDYWESFYDGLRQTIIDMQGCPDHTKLLFVIGDCGNKQSGNVPQDIVRGMKDYYQRLLPIFIQAKDRKLGTNYQQAYKDYKKQSLEILRRILPDDLAYEKFFISLDDVDDQSLFRKLEHNIAGISKSSEINELIAALEGGTPLLSYINNKKTEGDLPILYWKWVESLGDELGDQKTKRIYHKVVYGYIPVSDEWVEEFWLNKEDLMKWIRILRNYKSLSHTKTSRLREKFTDMMVEDIGQLLGKPPWEETGETVSEYIEKRKLPLPIHTDSPLLQYTYKEMREEIPRCELWRLFKWCDSIYKVLLNVHANPTMKVDFKLVKDTSANCGGISRKGEKIPLLVMDKRPQFLAGNDILNLGSNSYSYEHEFHNITIYWIPKDFLP